MGWKEADTRGVTRMGKDAKKEEEYAKGCRNEENDEEVTDERSRN